MWTHETAVTYAAAYKPTRFKLQTGDSNALQLASTLRTATRNKAYGTLPVVEVEEGALSVACHNPFAAQRART
jgi:hypothetical protein